MLSFILMRPLILRKKKARFVIVNPPVYRSQPWLHPSMLLIIAGWLEKEGFDVKILDAVTEDLDWTGFYRALAELQADMALLVAASRFAYEMMYTAVLLKKARKDTLVIATGPHFSHLPELTMRMCPEIDVCLRGDSIAALMNVIKTFSDGRVDVRDVPGTSYLEKFPGAGPAWLNGDYSSPGQGIFRDNGRPEPFLRLDELPMPAYHLVDMNTFFRPLIGGENGVVLISSWGCPHRCSFCFTSEKIWDSGWRWRSPELVLEEVKLLYHKYRKRVFWFHDNDFFRGRKRNEAFVEGILRSGMSINYWVETRADTMLRDRDILHLYKKSGFSWALIGFESVNQEKLDRYGKCGRWEDTPETIKLFNQHGIIIQAMFLFGDRYDDRAYYNEWISYLDKIKKRVFFMLYSPTPAPGTFLFDEVRERGVLEEFNFSKYNLDYPLMGTDFLTREEVTDMLWWARVRFYAHGNFMNVIERLPADKIWESGSNILASARDFFKYSVFRSKGEFSKYRYELMKRQLELMKRDPEWQNCKLPATVDEML